MKRLLLAVGLIAALSGPAAANCPQDYKIFWDKFDRSKYAKMSAEQIADLNRTALRGYDACTTGEERLWANNFFKQLDQPQRQGFGRFQQRRIRSSRRQQIAGDGVNMGAAECCY